MAEERLLDDARALQALVEGWPAGPVALDTEFVRERTYYARLCLIQLATGPQPVLIDTLAGLDLAPLVGLLLDSSRDKVLHAARQDLEVLLPLCGAVPAPVFDTQIAAALLGFPAQVGYGDLVQKVLGIELQKGHARTDWARRPLSAAQLAYAADDVRYLPPLAAALQERLAAAGRDGWAREDMAALADPALYSVRPADAWRRFKGLERMGAAERGRLQALAAWRERRAAERDLPRGWILADPALLELARRAPRRPEDLQDIESLPEKTVQRLGRELIELLQGAEPDAGPPPASGGRPSPEEARVFKRLQQKLMEIAEGLGLQPEVLATRRDLAQLLQGDEQSPALQGWRRELVGEALRAVI